MRVVENRRGDFNGECHASLSGCDDEDDRSGNVVTRKRDNLTERAVRGVVVDRKLIARR